VSGDWVTPEDEVATGCVIAAAIAVHRQLGPGFIESVYQRALGIELTTRGIVHSRECEIDIFYGGSMVGRHRLALVTDGGIVVELKAIRAFESAHFAQVRSYLRAANLPIGLLLNFGLSRLAVRRIVTRRRIRMALSDPLSLPTLPRQLFRSANPRTSGASEG